MTWCFFKTAGRGERYSRWKKTIKGKGLKVSVSKTKAFCTKEKVMQKLATKCLCAGVNLIQCSKEKGLKSIPSYAENA